MKKPLVLLIVFLTVIPVFAQEKEEKERRTAITFDPLPLIAGTLLGGFGMNTGFEHAFIRPASVKANIYFIGFNPGNMIDITEINGYFSMGRFNLMGRWYPLENFVHGWFFNGGMQYHYLMGVILYDEKARTGIQEWYNTFGLHLGAGYKAIFGKGRANFVLEPSLDYVFPLYSDLPFMNEVPVITSNYIGWILGIKGFRFELLMGVAF
jgi:hypothetical protein